MRFFSRSAHHVFSLLILVVADPAFLWSQVEPVRSAAPKNKVQVETNANGTGNVVTAQNLTAGGSLTVYAIERDALNRFVQNVAATWSLTSVTGGVVSTDLVAGADGKSAVMTGHLKGSAVIQAASGGLTVIPSGTITVVAGTATQIRVETAANGGGTLLAAQDLASGKSLTGYAISRDAFLNFVANTTATWTLSGVSGGVVPGDLVASADTRSAVFTGHKVGSAKIQASASGLTAVPSGTVTVIPGAAAQVRVETTPDGNGMLVPSQNLQLGKALTVYAVIRDASLNFVANAAASWTLINITGGIAQTDLVAAPDMKSAVLTGRAKGSAQIRATVTGVTAVPSGTITVFTIVATQIRVETAPDGSGVVVPIQNLASGRSLTVYAVARDSANQFIANQAADSWVLENSTGGIVAGDLAPSADKKSALFTARRVGSTQIKALSGVLTAIPGGTVTVIPGPPATFAATAGTPQSATVGTLFRTSLAAVVRDSSGNGVRGVAVTFTAPVSGAGGTFAGSTRTVATDSTGTAMAPPFTANTIAGKYSDTARAAGFTAPALYQLTNTPDLPVSINTRAGTPQSTPIITAFPVRLSVLVPDRFGNPCPNALVSFVPPASGPSGTFPGGSNTAMTDTAGIATAPILVANSIAGNFTLNATVAGVATPAVFQLTNIPGAPGSIIPTAGNPQSTTVATPFGLRLTVIVRDAASNPVKNAQVTFQAPPAGASVRFSGKSADTVRTDDAGFAVSSQPVADTIAGTYSVTATVAGLQTAANFSLTNLPGALTTFAISFADGDPMAVRFAGVPFDVELTALDQYANLATGFTGTADIGANLVLSTGGGTTPAFSAGILAQHPVAVASSGTGILTVVRTGGEESGTSDSFLVHNPAPTVVTILPASGTAGQSLDVVLEGTGFLGGVTAVNFGDRITTTTHVVSYTRMTVNLRIDSGATLGPRDVLVINKPPGGGTTTLIGPFTVQRNLYPASIALNGQIEFPSKQKPADYATADYRIVGLPGSSGRNLKDVLPGNQGSDWQAYWDNGQVSEYLVPFDGGSRFTLSAGRAFWLIGRGAITFSGTVPSAPLDSGAVLIPLHAGWNLITGPFAQNVSWTDVQAANTGLTEMLFGFSGAFVSSGDLRPYSGYYLFNGTGRQHLRVPFIPPAYPLPKAGADPSFWRLSLDLRAGSTVDRTAALGVSNDASEGLDRYDNRKPRAPGDLPSIEFQHPEWDANYPIFATDVRPPFTEREVWHFSVVSRQRQSLSLVWRGVGNLPVQLYVIDENHARAVNLFEDSGYTFSPVTDVSPFTVVAGSVAAVSEILSGIVPRVFALEANFPNPFNPVTTIPVSVPVVSGVRIVVYNILGEEVAVLHDGLLPAGRHWFTWDGRDRTGSPVAAGVYLCRMTIASGELFTRKMLLLK